MTLAWLEHTEALEEYSSAARWYGSQRPNLGDVFMDAADAAIESILDPTISWGFYRNRRTQPQIYSRRIAGFPLEIVYLRVEDQIFFVAYAHERRLPGYWEHRLSE